MSSIEPRHRRGAFPMIGTVVALIGVTAGLIWFVGRDATPVRAMSDEILRVDVHAVPASPAPRPVAATMPTEDDPDGELDLHRAFSALVAHDRAAALRIVEDLAPGERREELLRRLARSWAAVDFSGAVAAIAGLTDPVERKAAMEEACFQVAETNPGEAVTAWDALRFTADDHVLENLVQSWAGQDLVAAQAWASAQPPGRSRDQIVARVGYVMAQIRPADAAVFTIRELPPGPAQTEAAISILHQWAANDVTGATAWVEQFPDGPLRERALQELAGAARYRAGDAP